MQTTLDSWQGRGEVDRMRKMMVEKDAFYHRAAIFTKKIGTPAPSEIRDHSDEEDELLQMALRQSLELTPSGRNDELFRDRMSDSKARDLDGFDADAGRSWVYPLNRSFRQYQFDISRACLFQNTLVTLPTGLGKTFIAAVVMYNFYRWYPRGKVIFMAPTKPLVAQQIAACYEVMGIEQEHVVEMTGAMQQADRACKWTSKRVFFTTPQIISNDLSRGAVPARLVKCVVFDEAHRATGNYAYCQVVRELLKVTDQFRVLALSATPGKDVNVVQQVISNLLISRLELRSENSPELAAFSHTRNIEKVVVELDDEMQRLENLYLKVLENYIYPLNRASVLPARDLRYYNSFSLLQARDRMRATKVNGNSKQTGQLEYLFACCMSLCHGLELLLLHGQRTCYSYLTGLREGGKSVNNRLRAELGRNEAFLELMDRLDDKYRAISADGCTQAARVDDMLVSHPKLKKLIDLLLDHFNNQNRIASQKDDAGHHHQTRAIVFSQYRDSVEEIASLLRKFSPLIRPTKFVGQAGVNGRNGRGFSQKEQLRVVKEFRSGGFNVLVATCVGEEGLDVAEVDLIVCYDSPKSPVRLVQRMGRTGRRRLGRIVVLLTEGREEQIYKRSEHQKTAIFEAIRSSSKFILNDRSPRMVPSSPEPQCVRRMMQQQAPFDCAKARAREKRSAGSVDKSFQFLTDEELIEWKSKYNRAAEPHLPKAKILNLTRKLFISEANSVSSGDAIDPCRFYLWQNDQQRHFLVGHSSACELLVASARRAEYFQRLTEQNPAFAHFFCPQDSDEREFVDVDFKPPPLRIKNKPILMNKLSEISGSEAPHFDDIFPIIPPATFVGQIRSNLSGPNRRLGFKLDHFFLTSDELVPSQEPLDLRDDHKTMRQFSQAVDQFDFNLCVDFDQLFDENVEPPVTAERKDPAPPKSDAFQLEDNFDADFSFDFQLDKNDPELQSISGTRPRQASLLRSPRRCSAHDDPAKPETPNDGETSSQPFAGRRRPTATVRPFRINDSVVEENNRAGLVLVTLSSRKTVKRKFFPNKYGNEFISAEADTSFVDCSYVSSDEPDSDRDYEQASAYCEDSFVDVSSQPEFLNTQRKIDSPTEMRAVYLKSLNDSSAVGRRNKFRLAYERLKARNEPTSDVDARYRSDSERSSSAADDSYDLTDGFVVPNDCVEFMTQTQQVQSRSRSPLRVTLSEPTSSNDRRQSVSRGRRPNRLRAIVDSDEDR